MRRLIILIATLALLFCGWWAFASWSLASGVSGWFDARRSEGWQSEAAAVRSTGFPQQIRTVIENAQITDPNTGLSLSLPDLTLAAKTLWPGDMQVVLPAQPIGIATPEARINLAVETGTADLNLAPGTALELENLSYTSGPFRVEADEGGLFAGDSADMRMAQGTAPERYDITLNIGQFAPGTIPRRALLIPESWPLVFTALALDADIQFDRAWDRRALEQRRPQPRKITLHNAEAHWGALRLRIAGDLDVSDRGIAEGEITVKAENWQAMVDLAVTSGALPAEWRGTVEQVLTGLAQTGGNPEDIDVPLQVGGGLVRLGFLPVAPMPPLILR